jgi:hypothetical protein
MSNIIDLRFLIVQDLFTTDGVDVDIDKLDESNFTDKQRDMVMKISDKRRHLRSLQSKIRLTPVDEDVNSAIAAFQDNEDVPKKKHQPLDVNKISRQIESLEDELHELTESLLVSVGQTTGEFNRRKRKEMSTLFDNDSDGEVASPEARDSVTDVYHSDVPVAGRNDSIDQLDSKLRQLRQIRNNCIKMIENLKTEIRLNRSTGDDDEEDPLDAFMAGAVAEVSADSVNREEGKLVAVDNEIERVSKFIESKKLSEYLKSSRPPPRDPPPAPPTKTEPPRGRGTVWEEELQVDTSVPSRQKKVTPVTTTTLRPTGLDWSTGGLQGPGIIPPQRESVSIPKSNDKAEELRKKLGY